MQKRAVFYVYVIFWGQIGVENGAIVVRFSSPQAASVQSPADVPVAGRQPSSSSDKLSACVTIVNTCRRRRLLCEYIRELRDTETATSSSL